MATSVTKIASSKHPAQVLHLHLPTAEKRELTTMQLNALLALKAHGKGKAWVKWLCQEKHG